MTVRTRFAPSPTGYLHIGGVRTALFNWLFARRHGGQFVLRIDDTDASRNRAEAVKPILDGFEWLGIDWDEGPTKDASGDSFGPHKPYFQGLRNDKYVAAAMKLMAEGKAYPDYFGKEALEAMRKEAERAKRPFVFRGPRRLDDPKTNMQVIADDPRAVIRFKVREGGPVMLDDHVRGRIEVDPSTIGDPVIMREPNSNGVRPALYSFATVVDEIDFGITHVIRAAEHLSNTFPQILMFQALGAKVPEFGHIPLVNYKNEKMSKRKLPPLTPQELGALKACGWTDEELKSRDDLNIATVAYYRELGYLPAAIINYLGRLGWSLDAESEFIPLDVMKANFSLDRVTKAAGNFDPQKLYWLQGEYMKLVPTAEKVERCLPYLRRAGLVVESPDDATRATLTKVVEASGERIKLFSDLVQFAGPLLRSEPIYDPAAVEKSLKPALELLRGYRDRIAAANPFDAPTLEAALKEQVTAAGVKPNVLVAATRVAITGVTVGFGLYDTMAIMGKSEVLRRIDAVLGT